MSERVPLKEGLFIGTDAASVRLLGGGCPNCSRISFPAQAICPYCSADGCAAVPLSPRGRLLLCTTVINRPPGYDGPLPFGFGVVELAEGIRIITRVTHFDQAQPGQTMRLTLEPLHTDGGGRQVVMYAFEPASGDLVE